MRFFYFIFAIFVWCQTDLIPTKIVEYCHGVRDEIFINGVLKKINTAQGSSAVVTDECIHNMAIRSYDKTDNPRMGFQVKNKYDQVLYYSFSRATDSTFFMCTPWAPMGFEDYSCSGCSSMNVPGKDYSVPDGAKSLFDPHDNMYFIWEDVTGSRGWDITVCRAIFPPDNSMSYFYKWETSDPSACQPNDQQTRTVTCSAVHGGYSLSDSCCSRLTTSKPSTTIPCVYDDNPDPTPDDDPPEVVEKKGFQMSSLIFGVGVGAAVIAVLVGILFFIRHRKRKQYGNDYTFKTMMYDGSSTIYGGGTALRSLFSRKSRAPGSTLYGGGGSSSLYGGSNALKSGGSSSLYGGSNALKSGGSSSLYGGGNALKSLFSGKSKASGSTFQSEGDLSSGFQTYQPGSTKSLASDGSGSTFSSEFSLVSSSTASSDYTYASESTLPTITRKPSSPRKKGINRSSIGSRRVRSSSPVSRARPSSPATRKSLSNINKAGSRASRSRAIKRNKSVDGGRFKKRF